MRNLTKRIVHFHMQCVKSIKPIYRFYRHLWWKALSILGFSLQPLLHIWKDESGRVFKYSHLVPSLWTPQCWSRNILLVLYLLLVSEPKEQQLQSAKGLNLKFPLWIPFRGFFVNTPMWSSELLRHSLINYKPSDWTFSSTSTSCCCGKFIFHPSLQCSKRGHRSGLTRKQQFPESYFLRNKKDLENFKFSTWPRFLFHSIQSSNAFQVPPQSPNRHIKWDCPQV